MGQDVQALPADLLNICQRPVPLAAVIADVRGLHHKLPAGAADVLSLQMIQHIAEGHAAMTPLVRPCSTWLVVSAKRTHDI